MDPLGTLVEWIGLYGLFGLMAMGLGGAFYTRHRE